jgi:hypothetical protein
MAPPKGHPRYGGRAKGKPNKVTTEARVIFQALLNKMAPEAEAWLRECAQGIEIEKTLENGTTVVGRFDADPGKAVDLLLKMSEFYFPKLARTEKTIIDATDEEILAEIRRRRDEKAPP